MEMNEQLLLALNHALSGGKFEYTSFDYKAALAEFKGTKEYQDMEQISLLFNSGHKPDKYDIHPEIRIKHAVRRIGKLREVQFNPDGTIKRLKIGARYALSFYSITDLKFI